MDTNMVICRHEKGEIRIYLSMTKVGGILGRRYVYEPDKGDDIDFGEQFDKALAHFEAERGYDPAPIILLEKKTPVGRGTVPGAIVLSFWPKKKEFSTHWQNRENPEKPYMSSGHYFGKYNGTPADSIAALKEALKDFSARR